MKPELWEREYWGVVVALLGLQEETLESWLGAEDAKAPTEIVTKADAARRWVVASRIKRASDDFMAKYQDPAKREKVVAEAAAFQYWQHLDKIHLFPDADCRHPCPACGSSGVLLGFLVYEEIVKDRWFEHRYIEDDSAYYAPIEIVEKHFSVDAYYCPACELRLFGTDEISAADMPTEFEREEEREREYGAEYMNE